MKGAVFIETTIPSYYVARPPSDIVANARQRLTIDWWDNHRHRYELLTSQIVIDEIKRGDSEMAKLRLDVLKKTPLLAITDEVVEIALELVVKGIVPKKASDDALHIACAGFHQADYLLTWNCKHIANPHIQQRIRKCLDRHNLNMPVICTPEEFLEDEHTG